MKSIRECYPDLKEKEDGSYSFLDSPYDYMPLIESFGYKIMLKVDDSDYQGDTRVLYKDKNRYGILIFGWGSCSGCDSLQACESIKEIEDLQQDLFKKIKWLDSASECLEHFETYDWEANDFSWHSDETKDWIKKAKVILHDEMGLNVTKISGS